MSGTAYGRAAALCLAADSLSIGSVPGLHDRTVAVFGQKIRYVEAGHGPVVLLLHALGSDLTDWTFNIATLLQGHRVVAFDSVGSGLSDKPGIAYRPSTLIDFTRGLMDALGIERAALIGHSFGGAVAAGLALVAPERVSRLVLVASGYGYALPYASSSAELGFIPGTLRFVFPANLVEMRELVRRAIADPAQAADPAVVAGAFAQVIRAGHLMERIRTSFVERTETLDRRLSAIATPTLIIWGRKDGITPFALGERFLRDIPGARLLAFDEAAHFPHREDAPLFNASILRFLNGEIVGVAESGA